MLRTRIAGTGRYLPDKIVTNNDLEHLMDTSDEWIRQRTGILQRHMVEDGVGPSALGTEAGRRAMAAAGVAPDEVDYVICATVTADYLFPATACLIQEALGLKNAAAVDISAACSGFVYGLQMGDALIRAGVHRTVLVVAAEVLTKRVDVKDRNTAVLFGDGAGAVILKQDYTGRGILSTFTKADGSGADMLSIPAGGTREILTPDNVVDAKCYVTMDGRALFKRAVHAFGEAAEKALLPTGLSSSDVKLFIPHQANARIISAALERLGIPDEKVYLNLDRVANTSAASIPIALDEAVEKGMLQEGDILLLAAFGAGLTWGSAAIRW